MIQFINVTKSFRQQRVLDETNFTVEKGEVVVLIGPSGCGKTTTLKMINRLIEQTSGQILIGGEDITKKNVIELRRNMGYVIQQTGLFPHMTIKENIEIIPVLSKKNHAEIEARTLQLMEMIGLDPDEYLYRYPTQLSGGQQQRIGVARAFATDPEIILMDEPFSALDPITRSQLQDELVELQSQLKKTIVFVTHDMDEAIKIADKICIMYNGKILQFDTPENILKHPADGFVSEFVGRKRIWSSPELIKVKDIMITTPVTALGDLTLVKAIERMRASKVDSLLIVDNKHHLEGIVSAKAIRRTENKHLTLHEIMKTEFKTTSPGASIVSLLKFIKDNSVSNIPVVDDDMTLLGLVTYGSLVATLSQQFIDDEEVEG